MGIDDHPSEFRGAAGSGALSEEEKVNVTTPITTPMQRQRKKKNAEETEAKAKIGKKPRPFAGPEIYAHLNPVQDLLEPGLDRTS